MAAWPVLNQPRSSLAEPGATGSRLPSWSNSACRSAPQHVTAPTRSLTATTQPRTGPALEGVDRVDLITPVIEQAELADRVGNFRDQVAAGLAQVTYLSV
jgi:hypothetical protein